MVARIIVINDNICHSFFFTGLHKIQLFVNNKIQGDRMSVRNGSRKKLVLREES